MLLGVLLVAGAILCFVVRRYEKREKDAKGCAGLIEPTGGVETERKQPDIPVWRDKPQPKRLKE